MRSLPARALWISLALLSASRTHAAELKSGPPLPHRLVENWAKLPEGWNFGECASVAIDARDNVWVFHRGNRPVLQFDRNGNLIRSWGDGMFHSAHGVRVHPSGNLWFVDVKGHVAIQTTIAGRVLMLLGYRQGVPGDNNSKDYFNEPTSIAFAASGDMFVSDGYINSRVVKYNGNGDYLMHWGRKGAGDGEFNLVHDIAVDGRGRVLVADRTNDRIQIFDQNGTFLDKWTDLGRPFGLAWVAHENALYVCDGLNGRILKVNLEGQVLGVLARPGKLPGGLSSAHHIAVDSRGDIYIAEIRTWRVQKFARP